MFIVESRSPVSGEDLKENGLEFGDGSWLGMAQIEEPLNEWALVAALEPEVWRASPKEIDLGIALFTTALGPAAVFALQLRGNWFSSQVLRLAISLRPSLNREILSVITGQGSLQILAHERDRGESLGRWVLDIGKDSSRGINEILRVTEDEADEMDEEMFEVEQQLISHCLGVGLYRRFEPLCFELT